ncbi:MAG: 2TM domain-containing protein [Bacteroidota bacterium]
MFRSRKKNHEPEYVRSARKKVRAKKWFYRHFSLYLVAIAFLASMNMLDNYMLEPWFLYPALSWGMVISLHYLWVFGFPGTKAGTKEWEEKELAREIARRAPAKPLAALPPEKKEDPSVNMDEHLELREVNKEEAKSPVYRTDDLV